MSISNLSVRCLSHKYSKQWAIQDINFDIESVGIYGLLGSNGAGKSTTMNIICGVLYPSIGDVLIGGHSIREAPLEAKKQIGFLPQQAPLYPEFTVDEYLVHCAHLRRVPRTQIRAAVEAAKSRVGIAHFSKRLIGALSGGYRQRVGIAQAILHRPSLVVLDEPTNGLDPNQILEVRALIKDIARDCTVLLSTHILPEVEALCDEIKMIHQGKIVFEGTIEAFGRIVEPTSLVAVFTNSPDAGELLAINGVRSVEAIHAKKLRFHLETSQGVSEEIIKLGCRREWGLTEIFAERSSLEEVFARLSKHSRPASSV